MVPRAKEKIRNPPPEKTKDVKMTEAEKDARIRELREYYKQEIWGIIEAAKHRRAREKPIHLQKILLWEMDQIRHADLKCKSEIDRLSGKRFQEQEKPVVQKKETIVIDKRPTGKTMGRPRFRN